MNFKAIVIIGQTASGKSSLAHRISDILLEKNVNSEILNLDAFQIYQDISIGTAKPSIEEQKKYHYHGVDLCNIDGFMDANEFASFLHKTCSQIYDRGSIPICVGGSGLYLRAFLHGLDNFPPSDSTVRQKIRDFAQSQGWDKCYEWLKSIDPERAQSLHPNDHVRIERALEIYEITQTPPSQLQTKKDVLNTQACLFDAYVIHTEVDKLELRKNILKRTETLIKSGWLKEVEMLYQKYGQKLEQFNSMRAIGYLTLLQKVKDNTHQSIDEIIQQISTETSQYAKRQKTWNKKERVDYVIYPQDFAEITDLVDKIYKYLS